MRLIINFDERFAKEIKLYLSTLTRSLLELIAPLAGCFCHRFSLSCSPQLKISQNLIPNECTIEKVLRLWIQEEWD